MAKQGSSTALILVATGFFLFMAGCETSKHAEIMGDESLAAKKRAEQMQVADSSGIPLEDQGLAQESISGLVPESPPGATLRGLDRGTPIIEEGEPTISAVEPEISQPAEIPQPVLPVAPPVPDTFPKGNRGPAAGFGPEGPPMPSFEEPGQVVEEAAAEAPITAAIEPEKTFEPGPTGYEGQDLETSTSPPSGFGPQVPPLPTYAQESPAESEPAPEPEPAVEAPEVVAALPPPAAEEIAPAPIKEIADVFFDFDKYAIRSDAAATLVQNAQILQNSNTDSNVLIEGHCDERGTAEYNMVLGERRAQAVKNYLVDLGVPSSRIQIVSYGKERPFCTEHYDACWDQNRRGHFVLQ